MKLTRKMNMNVCVMFLNDTSVFELAVTLNLNYC